MTAKPLLHRPPIHLLLLPILLAFLPLANGMVDLPKLLETIMISYFEKCERLDILKLTEAQKDWMRSHWGDEFFRSIPLELDKARFCSAQSLAQQAGDCFAINGSELPKVGMQPHKDQQNDRKWACQLLDTLAQLHQMTGQQESGVMLIQSEPIKREIEKAIVKHVWHNNGQSSRDEVETFQRNLQTEMFTLRLSVSEAADLLSQIGMQFMGPFYEQLDKPHEVCQFLYAKENANLLEQYQSVVDKNQKLRQHFVHLQKAVEHYYRHNIDNPNLRWRGNCMLDLFFLRELYAISEQLIEQLRSRGLTKLPSEKPIDFFVNLDKEYKQTLDSIFDSNSAMLKDWHHFVTLHMDGKLRVELTADGPSSTAATDTTAPATHGKKFTIDFVSQHRARTFFHRMEALRQASNSHDTFAICKLLHGNGTVWGIFAHLIKFKELVPMVAELKKATAETFKATAYNAANQRDEQNCVYHIVLLNALVELVKLVIQLSSQNGGQLISIVCLKEDKVSCLPTETLLAGYGRLEKGVQVWFESQDNWRNVHMHDIGLWTTFKQWLLGQVQVRINKLIPPVPALTAGKVQMQIGEAGNFFALMEELKSRLKQTHRLDGGAFCMTLHGSAPMYAKFEQLIGLGQLASALNELRSGVKAMFAQPDYRRGHKHTGFKKLFRANKGVNCFYDMAMFRAMLELQRDIFTQAQEPAVSTDLRAKLLCHNGKQQRNLTVQQQFADDQIFTASIDEWFGKQKAPWLSDSTCKRAWKEFAAVSILDGSKFHAHIPTVTKSVAPTDVASSSSSSSFSFASSSSSDSADRNKTAIPSASPTAVPAPPASTTTTNSSGNTSTAFSSFTMQIEAAGKFFGIMEALKSELQDKQKAGALCEELHGNARFKQLIGRGDLTNALNDLKSEVLIKFAQPDYDGTNRNCFYNFAMFRALLELQQDIFTQAQSQSLSKELRGKLLCHNGHKFCVPNTSDRKQAFQDQQKPLEQTIDRWFASQTHPAGVGLIWTEFKSTRILGGRFHANIPNVTKTAVAVVQTAGTSSSSTPSSSAAPSNAAAASKPPHIDQVLLDQLVNTGGNPDQSQTSPHEIKAPIILNASRDHKEGDFLVRVNISAGIQLFRDIRELFELMDKEANNMKGNGRSRHRRQHDICSVLHSVSNAAIRTKFEKLTVNNNKQKDWHDFQWALMELRRAIFKEFHLKEAPTGWAAADCNYHMLMLRALTELGLTFLYALHNQDLALSGQFFCVHGNCRDVDAQIGRETRRFGTNVWVLEEWFPADRQKFVRDHIAYKFYVQIVDVVSGHQPAPQQGVKAFIENVVNASIGAEPPFQPRHSHQQQPATAVPRSVYIHRETAIHINVDHDHAPMPPRSSRGHRYRGKAPPSPRGGRFMDPPHYDPYYGQYYDDHRSYGRGHGGRGRYPMDHGHGHYSTKCPGGVSFCIHV